MTPFPPSTVTVTVTQTKRNEAKPAIQSSPMPGPTPTHLNLRLLLCLLARLDERNYGRRTFIGNLWELSKSDTNVLIQSDEQSTPSSCKHGFFIRENFIYRSFLGGCPRSFVDCRMGRFEWMDWMWSAHETTPSIHNASVTGGREWIGRQKNSEIEWCKV